ncbi:methyltransferase domain-containing protein [Candidatus Poribacteria bacterium]|nr:methyltransferase domain-containing protein [Candidatus Poribacteria bacterium]
MKLKKYLYLIAIPTQLRELVTAESIALTGQAPDVHGITISDKCTDAQRGAYLKSCTEVLFEGDNVDELCSRIRHAEIYADEFRVSVIKRPRNQKLNSMALASQIGRVIDGKPNLSSPRVVFPTVITPDKIWFGRLLSESDNVWLKHNQRPHVTSSSLPARLALTLVNLVASPGEHLLDPCCGTGTIVLAAVHNGIEATGCDINPRMVGATTKNLHHFGLTANVALEDARKIRQTFDVVATDLPYGISLVKDTSAATEILENLRTCAPKAGFIDTRDLRKPLTDLGYIVENVIPVPKLQLVRRIFLTSNVDQ